MIGFQSCDEIFYLLLIENRISPSEQVSVVSQLGFTARLHGVA